MRFVFGTIWKSLVYAYDSAFEVVIINLIWLLLTAAAIAIPAGLGSLLPNLHPIFLILTLVLTLPVSLSGLYYATSLLANQDYDGWKTFFVGIRKYYLATLLWIVVNITVVIALWFYWNVFMQNEAMWAAILQLVVISLFIWWALMQVYVMPLMMVQTKPSLWLALRNCLVTYVRWPGLSLVMSIVILIIMVLSALVTLPWMLFTASLSAFMACFAIREMLESLKPKEPEEEAGKA